MKVFALSTFISMALALDVQVVTQTAFHTVYGTDQAQESAPADVVYVTVITDQFGNILDPAAANISNISNVSNSTNSTSSESSYYSAEPVSFTSTPPTTLVTRTPPQVQYTPTTLAPAFVQPTTSVARTTSTSAAPPAPQSTSTPASGSSGSSGSSGASSSFQKTMLDSHNSYRSKHSAPALSWDSEVAQFAENYAAQYDCSGGLTHSGGPYGENLAITSGGAADAVKMWYDEINHGYDFSSSFTSSEVSTFGHFTQVVWKSTTKLGCAQKQCSNYVYYICNYDPAGNFLGQGQANIAPN